MIYTRLVETENKVWKDLYFHYNNYRYLKNLGKLESKFMQAQINAS